MPNPRAQKIGELLVKAKVLDALQLRSAFAQHENWGGRLAHVVAEMGLAPEERIVDALARGMSIQRVRLGNLPRDASALAHLDARFAEENGVFPIQLRDNGKLLLLAMADPTDLETLDEVGRRARSRVQVFIAGEQEIQGAILRHYHGREPSAAPARRAPAPAASGSPEEEEDFKIVDISGKTVMKRLADIQPSPESAAQMLNDILGEGAPASPQLTEEELQRLSTVQLNQQKSARILRAIRELLAQKGLLS